ncbi:MAG: fumarate hydratase [Candidatus Diapherotrites archaeon]
MASLTLIPALVELYRLASTELPSDVHAALVCARKSEMPNSNARRALDAIIENTKIAKHNSVPLCQDTGTPVFYVRAPQGYSPQKIKSAIISATKLAERKVPLRPNAVECLSGRPLGSTGAGIPEIHISQWGKNALYFELLMKGAGSENIGKCYSLPDESLCAERDFTGVEKCALDAVQKAQGRACPPMVLCIAITGSRAEAAAESKRLLLRKLGEKNKNRELAKLENSILKKANSLGIGPSGLGGKSTLLAVHISVLARHPASMFVDVSFSCWALRRRGMLWQKEGAKYA